MLINTNLFYTAQNQSSYSAYGTACCGSLFCLLVKVRIVQVKLYSCTVMKTKYYLQKFTRFICTSKMKIIGSALTTQLVAAETRNSL